MTALLAILAALTFADSKTLALQIRLDQAGYSCNTIDGSWGRKTQRALACYLEAKGLSVTTNLTGDAACERFFPDSRGLFTSVTVTANDLASLKMIPTDPAARAELDEMPYETIAEMLAERGHLSVRALERLNPGINWATLAPGTAVRLPNVTPIETFLSHPARAKSGERARPAITRLEISLSQFEIRAIDANGRVAALFPCSIARSKAKRPQQGELTVTDLIARPNYTYTAEHTTPGRTTPARYVWPSGPNCPVGIAWIGLNLPSYGIHGTTKPETIGTAESHGCFRLANWNAARLYSICPSGTKVVIRE